MVVVLIISVLATLAVPAIQRTRMKAKTAAIVGDFRTFASAFETYAQETGKWPAEAAAGSIPSGMGGRLSRTAWRRKTPMGGCYNWEYDRVHFGVRYKAAIAISATAAAPLPLDVAQLTDIDERIDDGNLMSGSFRLGTGNIPLFIIQP